MSRILVFVPSLRGGGAEKSAVLLANEFHDLGHEVTFVISSGEGVYFELLNVGLNFVNLKKGRVLSSVFSLATAIRVNNPDFILSFMNYANISCWLAWNIAGRVGKFFPSERTVPSSAISLGSHFKEYVFKKLIKIFYNNSEKVICISNSICEDLVEKFGVSPSKVVTVYNPIVNDALFEAARLPVDCNWLTDNDEFCIVSAGRLHPDKDYGLLLHAFSEVVQTRSAKLIVLGEGEEKEYLLELSRKLEISDSVRFMGFQKNPFKFYEKADLFVLCSRYEGFGNVLVEAMACGARVIARKGSGGPDEIIESDEMGGLFRDKTELVRLILAEIDVPSGCEQSRKRAEQFSVAEIADRYLAVFSGTQTSLDDR